MKNPHKPFEPKGQRHPSGRPLPRDDYKRLGFKRIPNDGLVLPRLQRYGFSQAIGFHAKLVADEDDE